jgi:hypothetical protein
MMKDFLKDNVLSLEMGGGTEEQKHTRAPPLVTATYLTAKTQNIDASSYD